MSSAYLRLLIFLPAILIPAFASSSPAFLMMYSAYKLHKQGDNIQPWCAPFLIWNQSVVPCPVLTVASWPAYRSLRRQVSSVQFSRSVMSDSLWPHKLQHARPPYPSQTRGVHSDDHQVSDAIQPSQPLLSPSPPAPNPSQHQSLFRWVSKRDTDV